MIVMSLCLLLTLRAVGKVTGLALLTAATKF